MKVIIKIAATLVCLGSLGCVGYGSIGVDPFEGEGLPEEVSLCEGCLAQQSLRGELMLFVNTKLTGADANFTANYPLDNEGRYVGNALYLYDPDAVCEDGGAGCRLAKLGNLWLGDSMGPLSLDDQSLQRFSVRDLAWHPERGLWGLSYDPLNDEWGVTALTVPDWTRSDNRIDTVRYAFLHGPVDAETTDACYWRQSMTGLGFVGDELWAGSAGKPGNGLDARGVVFRIDPGFVAEPRHCVYAGDITQDPEYYACAAICSVWTSFDEKAGVAGDLVDAKGGGLLAMARAEDAAVLPAGQNVLFDVDVESPGRPPTAAGPYIADIAAGLDIEGLARVDGVLYGINTAGTVYRISEAEDEGDTWKVAVHDELGPLFTASDLSVRIRGATSVVVE